MFQKILVPLDGSEFAEEALEYAVTLARQFQGELVLLRAAISPQMYISEWTLGLPDSADLYNHLRQEAEFSAQNYIQLLLYRLQEKESFKIDTRSIVSVDVTHTILSTAKEVEADLIVMSTHGRTGLQRIFMGSIAENVVRHANIPVLLIRSTHKEGQTE